MTVNPGAWLEVWVGVWTGVALASWLGAGLVGATAEGAGVASEASAPCPEGAAEWTRTGPLWGGGGRTAAV